jgi:hypothetical protein
MLPKTILRLSIPFIILAAMSWAWFADKSGSVHATEVALADCGKGVDQAKASLAAAQKNASSLQAAEDRLDRARTAAAECDESTRAALDERTTAMRTAMVLGIVFSLAALGAIVFGIARRSR